MSYLGPISNDYLLATDAEHEQAMESGSQRLQQAIEDYFVARAHRQPQRPTPGNLIWRNQRPLGTNLRPSTANDVEHLIQNREPCVTCGVRADRHDDHGCKRYRRQVAA